jgi:hypothetical protein
VVIDQDGISPYYLLVIPVQGGTTWSMKSATTTCCLALAFLLFEGVCLVQIPRPLAFVTSRLAKPVDARIRSSTRRREGVAMMARGRGKKAREEAKARGDNPEVVVLELSRPTDMSKVVPCNMIGRDRKPTFTPFALCCRRCGHGW